MRIKGDMDDLVPCADVLRHVPFEILFGPGDVHPSAALVEDLVPGEQLPLALVHFHAVVSQMCIRDRPINEVAHSDERMHYG